MSRRSVERRSIRLGRMTEIVAEAERLGASGAVRSTGQWTPAQNLQHVARVIQASLDGFPASAPAWLRIAGRLLRSRALNRPMAPGFKVPARLSVLGPDPDVEWEAALAALREQVGRIESGERMTRPSPIFGELSHEEWEQLHCRHAELHLGFLHAP